ncbi:HAMP domain-containing histidine kinase [Caldalkalibacillus thermarum TA2.A1]|uniref:Circadian input-output histidine kinase CikA n=2 Tax=Caldalkalibacillus thermarum (strain TA2.A1) TaxID=986075 RepID=A0A8X8L6Q5_CALTT|nr:HAMP domain-containing sensor histidine kinase [Caldalkalibacillus thermarum]QZT33217.1 HAMP domain-containing histidine kinase [Caldalkalibacillus thermarum TA2.A1]
MNLNRIDVKLGVMIMLLFLVLLLPLGFVINQIFSGFYYTKVQEETSRLSAQYAQLLANNRNEMMIPMIEMMAQFSQVRIFIINPEGQIIAVANVPGLNKGDSIMLEELDALALGQTIETTYTDPEGKPYYLTGTPIMDQHSFYGGVFVLSPIEGIYQSLRGVRNLLVLAGFGAFFIALGFTMMLSRSLSRPLLQMETAARKIAKGHLETRVEVGTADEIGSLAMAINDLARDLKRYRDTRREFLANISHELRTPLTYLEGYAKVLKEGLYQTAEERDKYLDIIHKETKRLNQLINDLSELAKMEEGRISLNFQWVDIMEVLESVLSKTSLKAKEKGLLVQVDIEEDLPLLYGDGLRLEQIFLNLVENAIRYTDVGTVSVQAKLVGQKIIKTIVEDTGRGIPKEELSYIFERFYRVEKSRSRQHGGSGLGLAIVKKLVELHGGVIMVSSQPGKGTRFEVDFPVAANKQDRKE